MNASTHVPAPAKPEYILGVDIGGQSIKPKLYKINGNELEPTAWGNKHTPIKGLSRHVLQMASLIADARSAVEALGGELKSIGIASPGRFEHGVIKPGTNPNLSELGDSFDHVNLAEKYREALDHVDPSLNDIPLVVANDGNAMLAGMLNNIKMGNAGEMKDQNGDPVPPAMVRGTVALFGIGTGIGHAIARMKGDGYEFVTDGHASKLWVQVDAEDRAKLAAVAAQSTSPEIVTRARNDFEWVRAEDLFRAPVINAMAGVGHGGDMRPDENVKHEAALEFAGKYMVRTIALIKSGEGKDVVPENEWTAEEKAQAAATGLYLIGGGVGRSPDGARIIGHAKAELEKLGLNGEIKLVQMTIDNPATLAAAEMAKRAVISQQQLR